MSRDSYRLRTGWALALLLALLVVSQPSSAADLTQPPAIMREVGETGPVDSRKLILPYIFATETLDVAGGAAFGASAWPQEQSSLFSAVLGTTNESWGLFFVGTSLKVAGTQRLFIDTSASLGKYTDLRSYIDGNPEYPDSRAGSNDSDPNDFISGEGNHNWLLLNFKYVLPIGHARESASADYALDRGILVSGATGAASWNPLRSGRTLLQIEPILVEIKKLPEQIIPAVGVAIRQNFAVSVNQLDAKFHIVGHADPRFPVRLDPESKVIDLIALFQR